MTTGEKQFEEDASTIANSLASIPSTSTSTPPPTHHTHNEEGRKHDKDDAEKFIDLPVEYGMASTRIKILVLIFTIVMGVGVQFKGPTFRSMKPVLTDQNGTMKLSNDQFLVALSADQVLNIFMPLAVGFLIDWFGTGLGALTSTAFVMCGRLFVASAFTSNNFGALMIGRLLFRIGSGSVGTVQRVIIAQWFPRNHCATGLSLLIGFEALWGALGRNTLAIMTDDDTQLVTSAWISAGLAMAGSLFALVYVALSLLVNRRTLGAHTTLKSTLLKKKPFTPIAMLHFPVVLWFMFLVSFVTSIAANSWTQISPLILAKRDGTNADDVSRSLVSPIITAITGLAAGLAMDRYGHRITAASFDSALMVSFFTMILFTAFESQSLVVLLAMVGPMRVLANASALPILIHSGHLGTAFALNCSIHGIAFTVADYVVGRAQDAGTPGEYKAISTFIVTMAGLSLVLCLIWWNIDRAKYGGVLQKSNKALTNYYDNKQKTEWQAAAAGVDVFYERPVRPMNVLYVVFFFTVMITTWTLFLIKTYTDAAIKRGSKNPNVFGGT